MRIARTKIAYSLWCLIIASNMAQAIDITTHCSCKKLKMALQEAMSLNYFKFVLRHLSYHESITPQDYADIIIQAQWVAQEHKDAWVKRLADTQSTPNHTDIAQGAAAIIGSCYLIINLVATLYYRVSFAQKEAWYFYPIQKYIDEKLHKTNLALGLSAVQTVAALTLAPCAIIWGVHKLGQKKHRLATLHEKIANLDAISAYLEELHTAQTATP